jgi:hypothetical protein
MKLWKFVKTILKRNRFIFIYYPFVKSKVITIRNRLRSERSVIKYLEKKYEKVFGEKLDWNNLITYTQKMHFYKLFMYNSLKTTLTDKILVRDYVATIIGDKYLIPLIGVFDKFNEINISLLPQSFVIKTNHGSGTNIIVNEKSSANFKEIKTKVDLWLKINFAYLEFEMQYLNIKPRILIEKNMGTSEKMLDYKFLCFNGKVEFCWIDFDRFTNHKRNVYNLNWELQKWNQFNYGNLIDSVEKPKNFEEMVMIASKLSEGFSHVRVDLYNIEGRVYFGEMTFTNGAGLEKFTNKNIDVLLGDIWGSSFKERQNK